MQATGQHNTAGTGDVPAASFEGAANRLTLAQHWLNLQCNMFAHVSCGLLFRIDGARDHAVIEGSCPHAVAVHDDLVGKVLRAARQTDVTLERFTREDGVSAAVRIYQPVDAAGTDQRQYVVVLELSDGDDAQCKTVVDLMHWNVQWLVYAMGSGLQAERADLAAVFSMAVSCLDQTEFHAVAMALVNELAAYFSCQRVSLGLCRGHRIAVEMVSHSASFKLESNLIQAIGGAMDEAVDQDRTLVFPGGTGSSDISLAHGQLARQSRSESICTVPISEGGEIIGALTLEWDEERVLEQHSEIRLIEQLVTLIAPVLALKQRDEQSLPMKVWHSLGATFERLFGAGNARLKLATVTGTLLVAFFGLAQGNWRVTADALVEGSVQRTIAAPIDGYIASAEARAGDIVTADQVLGTLDDRDLRLERLKWSTMRQQLVGESREAMAQHNRAELGIINAKIEQADAELKLIDEQLARTRLLAPFDGIVITGDLSQSLGTPVSRGDTLFKVAPLKDYRIVLKVDETDIAPVAAGQVGALLLASMPGRKLEFTVEKVTPVSTAGEGRNFFRVEASLRNGEMSLQPGMEGVGKIAIGEARLFWIWTHDLVNWLRLQTWTWWR